MSTTKKVKLALTGFENGHCNALYLGMLVDPDVEIVAVSFTPGSKSVYYGRITKEMFEGVDIFYNVEEMLNAHPEIEACVLGSSNRRHMEEFRLCAERGIHVLSMKAPTYDIDEYDEMIHLAKEKNLVVHIELQMRWMASIQRLRDIIESGCLGEIRSFAAYNYSHNPMNWCTWLDIPEEIYGKRIPIRPGSDIFRGGAISDHPHIFDLVRFLFKSDFDTIYAEAAPNMRDFNETEDLTYIIGKLQNGVIFSLDPSYANREHDNPRIKKNYMRNISRYPRPVQVEMQITGSKGTVYSDCFGTECVETIHPENQHYSVLSRSLDIDDQRRIFIREFIAEIRSGSNNSLAPFADHKKTIMGMNAAYDSIYTGKPVKL